MPLPDPETRRLIYCVLDDALRQSRRRCYIKTAWLLTIAFSAGIASALMLAA